MKKILYLVLIALVLSCQDASFDSLNAPKHQNKSIEDSGARLLTTSCDVTGPLTVNCATGSASYTVTYEGFQNPSITWSVQSGGMAISGSAHGTTAVVVFPSGFTSGTLLVELQEGIIVCSETIVITGTNDVPPPAPGNIYFDFLTPPTPFNANFCTQTRFNLLYVDPVPCATSYQWSITPSAGVQLYQNGHNANFSVFSPGTYLISVVAINAAGQSSASYLELTAEHCMN